jgi:hypothetical protein
MYTYTKDGREVEKGTLPKYNPAIISMTQT